MQPVENLVKKLKDIKNEIEAGADYETIQEKYGTDRLIIKDIKDIMEFEELVPKIANIQPGIDKGENFSKISADLGCGSSLTRYILNELEIGNIVEVKKNIKNNYIRKIEEMWRSYRYGKNIYIIARDYQVSVDYAQSIIKAFDKKIERYRKKYEDGLYIRKDQIKAKVKEELKISDDIIEYIFEGDEFDPPMEIKKESNLGDEGRDE